MDVAHCRPPNLYQLRSPQNVPVWAGGFVPGGAGRLTVSDVHQPEGVD